MQKAGFRAAGASTVALPGAPREDLISFKTVSELGSRANFTLQVPSLPQAVKELQERGISTADIRLHHWITDPDGNEIVLTAKPVVP